MSEQSSELKKEGRFARFSGSFLGLVLISCSWSLGARVTVSSSVGERTSVSAGKPCMLVLVSSLPSCVSLGRFLAFSEPPLMQ